MYSYRYYGEYVSWLSAKQSCESEGMSLAKPKTALENRMLRAALPERETETEFVWWIGAYVSHPYERFVGGMYRNFNTLIFISHKSLNQYEINYTTHFFYVPERLILKCALIIMLAL